MTARPSSPPSETARVLAACDGLLHEVGRREHRFSWLRDPDGPDDQWLVVDGYYPSNRVVVYWGDDPDELRLYRHLVPQHGLHLLTAGPDELPDDQLAAQALLRKQLEQDGWSPRGDSRPLAVPPRAAPYRSEPARHAVTPGGWTDVRRSAPPDPQRATTAGLAMGILLIVVVLFEAYLGLVVLAINSGDPVLGAGLLVDAAARAFGTLSARQRHDAEQSWSSLLLGSPSVAGHEQPARGIGILALFLVVAGILTAIL